MHHRLHRAPTIEKSTGLGFTRKCFRELLLRRRLFIDLRLIARSYVALAHNEHTQPTMGVHMAEQSLNTEDRLNESDLDIVSGGGVMIPEARKQEHNEKIKNQEQNDKFSGSSEEGAK